MIRSGNPSIDCARRNASDRRLAHAQYARELSDTFAFRAFFRNAAPLVVGEFEFGPHFDPAGGCPPSSLARAALDQLPFELSQSAEHGQHQAAVRCSRIGPCVAEGPEKSASLIEAIEHSQ